MRKSTDAAINRPLHRALAVGLILGLMATAARAQEPERYKGWQVRSFEVEGLQRSIAKELSRGLVLSGEKQLLRTERPRFYPALLTDDIARARLFLARRGYPRATMTPRFEPRPDQRSVGLVLEVDLGAAIRVAAIGIEGAPDAWSREIRDLISLRPQGVFSDLELERSWQAAERFLRDRGYANAAVTSQVTPGDGDVVTVAFEVSMGDRFEFGEVRVSGAAEDLVDLVQKSTEIDPGDPYAPSALDRARLGLRRLDLFRQIRLNALPGDNGRLHVETDLVPLPARSLEFGAGYLTDDQFWGRAQWKNRNLFRRGRGLELRASASRFLLGSSVGAWYPGLLDGRARGTLRLSAEHEREQAYTSTTYEIGISLQSRLTELSTWQLKLGFSDVQVNVKTTDTTAFLEEGGVLTVVSLRLDRDSSDSPLFPQKGSISALRLLVTPIPALTGAEFVSTDARQTWYRSVVGSAVLAGRVGGGVAVPFGTSQDLLPRYRFFAGGASSMRGFRRRQLGPKTDGDPTGGELRVEASSELRFPVFKRVQGAAFVDVGQVFERHDAVQLHRVEIAVGPALMVRTPVGPVRGDVGFLLGPLHDVVFHLTIGQPF